MGEILGLVLPWVAGILAAMIALALLRKPLGYLVKLGARVLAALAALAIWSPLGALVGAGLGVNFVNAVVVGLLGLPGFGLLLMLHWVCAI